MTARADLIRNRRRTFAMPGGLHDRLIGFLAKALPAAIGVIAAVMILSPLGPRGEVSFLLDRNKVAVTTERMAVDKAMYRGEDEQGRPFLVTAGSAVQSSATRPLVEMNNLMARMQLDDGLAELWAPAGNYNFRDEEVLIEGLVNFRAADGYRMVMENVQIDLNTKRAVGSGGVEGALPSGTFRADSISANLDDRTVVLEGNARFRMTPGN